MTRRAKATTNQPPQGQLILTCGQQRDGYCEAAAVCWGCRMPSVIMGQAPRGKSGSCLMPMLALALVLETALGILMLALALVLLGI